LKQNNPISPPLFWLRFFRWFCRDQYAEDIEGDLLERFERNLVANGERRAKIIFRKDVLKLLKPGLIKQLERSQQFNQFGMFKNNIIVAKRQLLRHKMYSTIKIGGFSIGIAVCLLMALSIREELSFDKHIQDHNVLYRAVIEYKNDPSGGDVKASWFAPPFAEAVKKDFPEVVQTARTIHGENFGAGSNNIREQGNPRNSFEKDLIFADPELLELFRMEMIYGDLVTALDKPQSMVLTQSVSKKLFPNENPIGKVVFLNDETDNPYSIEGVVEDPPKNSTLQFRIIASLKEKELWKGEQSYWGANNYQVFVRIRPDADLENLNSRLKEIGQKYILPLEKDRGNPNAEEEVKNIDFHLQLFTDVHLRSSDVLDPFQKSDIKYIWVFGVIASFILGLACINFINLSTAKSANRSKEVGLRKTLGSNKSDLITQFLTESVLYSILSFLIAILLASFLLPYFNQLSGKLIEIPWNTFWFIPILLISAVLIGVIAGIYPAFYLSSFQPAAVLKGKLSMHNKGAKLRNTLVVFQFTASIVLITGTLVVYRQMEFILNKNVGFSKEQVIMLQSPYLLGNNLESFKNELLKFPEVENASFSGFLPIQGTLRNGNTWWKDGKTKEDRAVGGQNWLVDYTYLETLGISIKEGRNFSKDLKTDSAALIINEAMAKALGIAESPIGARITNRSSNSFVYTVVGVTSNFNFEVLTEPVKPLAMRLGNNLTTGTIRVKSENVSKVIGQVEATWKEIAPNQPFIYEFMDQRFAQMYSGVKQIRNILTAFAVLAIIIACLGLFGLSVFMVEQRNKEISVRLVLGAKMSQIMGMLTVNFMKPIVLALLLAIPVTWIMMTNWLEDYEYKIDLTAGLFITAGLGAILIAMLTISFQSIKAALTSPSKGLRNE